MDLGSLIPLNFGSFSFKSLVNMFIWGSVIGSGLGVLIKVILDKVKYIYWGEVFKRRQEFESEIPSAKVIRGKAGYFKNRKNGRTVFRIKYGLMPWQQIELSKLPNPEYMVGNTVYYLQLNKDNLVQAKLSLDWDAGLKLKPVEDDLKHAAYLDYYDKERVLETSKLTPVTVGTIVLCMIIVAFIIGFYFLSKA